MRTNGAIHAADAVVFNADVVHAHRDLLGWDAIETWADWGPPESAAAHNAHLGSIFALAASYRQSAFFRPPNRSPDLANAHFVGGGTQPGGGIPLVLLSGQITADLVLADAARTWQSGTSGPRPRAPRPSRGPRAERTLCP